MKKKPSMSVEYLWSIAVLIMFAVPLEYFFNMKDVVWTYIVVSEGLIAGIIAAIRFYMIKENKRLFKKVFFVDMMYILLPNISWMVVNYLLYINNIESNITLMFVFCLVAIPLMYLERKMLKEYILYKQQKV